MYFLMIIQLLNRKLPWRTLTWSFNFFVLKGLNLLSVRFQSYQGRLEVFPAFLRRLNQDWQNSFPMQLLTGVIEREQSPSTLCVIYNWVPRVKGNWGNTALVLYASQLKFFSKVLLTAALLSNSTFVCIFKNW